MAEAGFHYTGSEEEPDAVECFFCEKSLDGWLAEDDPWVEHLNHSPNCLFAKLQQPENALMYYQFNDIKYELFKNIIMKCKDKLKNKLKESSKNELANIKKILKAKCCT